MQEQPAPPPPPPPPPPVATQTVVAPPRRRPKKCPNRRDRLQDASPSARNRSHSGALTRSAVCSSAHARSSASGREPRARLRAQRSDERLRVGHRRHRPVPGVHAGQLGGDRAPPEAGVLEDPVGQRGVVERLDPERQDPDVGAEDQPRRLLVAAPAEPDEARRRAAPREVGVVLALVLVPRADEQQDELGHLLGDGAQQRPVRAPAEVAERDGDHRAARVRAPGRSPPPARRAAPRGPPRARARRACPRRRTSAPSARRPPRAAPRAARASTATRRRPSRSGPSARTRARPRAARPAAHAPAATGRDGRSRPRAGRPSARAAGAAPSDERRDRASGRAAARPRRRESAGDRRRRRRRRAAGRGPGRRG